MKSFDSRVYSINDFVEWDQQKTLVLNPTFQRRAIWSEKAKSYLMDTILRGKPIPKIFIRQKINPTTKTSIRDVVDGQQRLRTILSYVQDGFVVSKQHNAHFGGKFFSQLDVAEQTQVLGFEVSVDLLVNLPDEEILDIFGRLNAYAIVLNEQEKINADHFGPFKVLADDLGRKYYNYWLGQKIISDRKILRMEEVNLVADLLIVLKEGVKAKRQIKKYYDAFEEVFDADPVQLSYKFDVVINHIGELFPEGLSANYFHRVNLFYSLFTAVAHCTVGVPGFEAVKRSLASPADVKRARNGLDRVGEIIESASDPDRLTEAQRQFTKDIRLATTDQTVRERRARCLLGLMA